MNGSDDFFEELRREYLTEAPVRLAELRKDLRALKAGESDAAESLKARFHRLAGSGGSYGFPEISTTSREAERWLKQHPTPNEAAVTHLDAAIARVSDAFDAAAAELGLPQESSRRQPFGWQALILGSPGPLSDRVDRALTDAQYSVSRQPADESPSALSVSARPDVAVLVLEDVADLIDVVARWSSPGPARPASVVLVSSDATIDPLLTPFANLDYLLPSNRVETELVAFVRAIGQSASAPPSIVLVDGEAIEVAGLKDGLVAAGGRVQVVGSAAELRTHLGQEAADLIVTEWALPDTTGPALLRFLRYTGPYLSTPVVVYSNQVSDQDRVAAIRAGADDVVLKSSPRQPIVQSLLARIDRSRRIRALAHRDDLTGLLNYNAMVEELDAALAFAVRAEESFGLIVLDLDHFRRLNELHGYHLGDQLLSAVADAVTGSVRSSDFVARLGGEEIGVLVRRCSSEHTLALAEKLRGAIAGVSIPLEDKPVTVRASAGIACYPTHGGTAQDLLRAADAGLAQAKASGRDRIGVRPSGS